MARVVILCTVLAVAGVLAANASAAEPTKTSYTLTGLSSTLSGVCSFDVSITTNLDVTEIDYTDASGMLTRIYLHTVEQDTFSANGKSITGEPFTANLEVLLDSTGAVTHVYGSGVVERIILPSGTLFLSAGRSDFVLHPGATFLLSPDFGNPGDVAAFCAALS